MAMPLRKRVSNEARRAGLFLFTQGDQWQFLSAVTGKCVMTWFASDGNWLAMDNSRGHARSPLGALHAAIAVARK